MCLPAGCYDSGGMENDMETTISLGVTRASVRIRSSIASCRMFEAFRVLGFLPKPKILNPNPYLGVLPRRLISLRVLGLEFRL